jgi:hypothetical protein
MLSVAEGTPAEHVTTIVTEFAADSNVTCTDVAGP